MNNTQENLEILGVHKIRNRDVINPLLNLFIFRGIQGHIRSYNGLKFTAKAMRKWLNQLGMKTLFIEPGSSGKAD